MKSNAAQSGVPIDRFVTSHVAHKICLEIQEAGGAELFAILRASKPGELFDQVEIACRGTEVEVPAILSRTAPGEMTLHNHPSGDLRPSHADLHLAGIFGEEGIGSMIIDNKATRAYVLVEPFQKEELHAVAPEELHEIFRPKGKLSAVLEGYESRQGQVDMAISVASSLHQGKITSIEAGTGTGKSLAYLIPALMWAKKNRKRILVATKTITLQEQLLFKDIPIAKRVMEDPPETALIKGRSNYVCLRKLHDAESDQEEFDFGEDFKSMQAELKTISDWVEQHPSGDRADLPFQPSHDLWESVQSDSDMCMGSACPYYQDSPFFLSRRAAAKASLLIVNQALLFTDLSVRISTGNYTSSAIIPPYFSVIVDEAHSIEDLATDHFGSRLTSFGLRNTIGKFLSPKGNRGILERLHKKATRYLLFDFARTLEENSIKIQSTRDDVLFQLEEFSNLLHEYFNKEQFSTSQVHLDQPLLISDGLELLRKEAGSLSALLTELCRLLRSIFDEATETFEDHAEEMEGFLLEYQARLNRLKEVGPLFKRFAAKDMEEQVQWLTLKKWKSRRNEFEYQISPIDVRDLLIKGMFKPFHSIIATSATLDLKDDFHFFQSRSGIDQLDDKEKETFRYKSPFPLAQQASFAIPLFFPQPSHSSYVNHLKDCILLLSQTGKGGTLVLFTSYALLNQMVRMCEHELGQRGIDLLVQGRDPRSALVQRFISTQGVLFGTDTFWEGIDLRGNLLTKLLITKLPFRQLGDPVFEARSRKIKAEGGNDFKDYSLPLALLKFKQGTGRLIRSKTDYGLILVADRRIIERNYGKKFFEMAPEFPKIQVMDLIELQNRLGAMIL